MEELLDPLSTLPMHNTKLWFSDGNIILRAGGTLFKVYRGILCRESRLFQDILSLPQPTSDLEESYEGCAIIDTHDSASYMDLFLSTIFDHT